MEKENKFSDNVFSSLIASISTNGRIGIIFERGAGESWLTVRLFVQIQTGNFFFKYTLPATAVRKQSII